METSEETILQAWAQRLRQFGFHQYAASFLEASGPLNLIGAQMVYLGQPVLSSIFAGSQLKALAEMLEEPEQTKVFIRCLREEPA